MTPTGELPLTSTPISRVLICTDTFPPQVNGVSVVTALTVAGLRQRGWHVGVVAPSYPKRPSHGVRHFATSFGAADVHVAIPSLPFPPYPDIRLAAPAFAQVSRAVRAFRPHIIHCATEFTIGRLGQIVATRAGLPIVSSYHTDFSRYTDAYGMPRLKSAVSNYIARFHARARRTYTPSHMARADLLALGIRDVEVWGRTVDTSAFTPTLRSVVLRRANDWEGKFVMLHVGRLAAEKGVHRILDAFRIARELLPAGTVRLVIAGGGPEEASLRRAAPSDVSFYGVLDHKRSLPKLYASADAFVFSSLTETLGLVVLEAMASGLPVIATPAGGVADHLRDGENGLAFPGGDVLAMAHAMVRLVMDRSLRDRLAIGARRTAEGLDWEGELDRLEVSYREVCESCTPIPERSPRRFITPVGLSLGQTARSTN